MLKSIKYIFKIIMILAIVSLFACSKPNVKNDYNFTDSLGNKISLPYKPKKVAILFSSFAEIWKLSGGDIAVTVGDSVERDFVSNNVILVDETSGHTNINMEVLISSNVDFVIGTADYSCQIEACKKMNSLGVPSALFKVENFNDYLHMLDICTDILDTKDNYQKYGLDIKDKIDQLLQTVPNSHKENILFLRSGSSIRSTKAKNSNDNFAAKMLQELNTFNIADSATNLLDSLSLETIIKENPKYIFISIMGDENAVIAHINELFTKDGWKDLDAIKNNNYYFLPKDLFHYKPNNKWYKSYEYLYSILYGESNV